ncbi:PAS domain S-box protein [Citrifermentans bremense]|uniref:PAS domain S-box protein n=1 Tax=Citrifermentans bremense TaxID=60035 RepID=UPI00047E7210|nr:PAS domain S-box protein [Citrifermentans bremense]
MKSALDWQVYLRRAVLPLAAWTVFIALLAGTNMFLHHQDSLKEAENEARDYFRLNMAYRAWGSSVGGVYTFKEKVAPNPYLKVPQRDVATTDGIHLTLVNPAYMTRMVFDGIAKATDTPIINRIVSLKPLNPQNAPDAWERESLMQFEQGSVVERSHTTDINGKPYLRFISAFIADESCLKCHIGQGYKKGDLLGGIVISIPLEGYFKADSQTRKTFSAAYFLLWAVGSGGILASVRRRHDYEEELRAGEEKFRTVCDWTQDWEYWKDQQGEMRYVSPSCLDITGYSAQEFMDDSELAQRLVHPDDSEAFANHLEQGVAGSPPDSIEFRIATKSGAVRWIHHACRPVFSNGNFLGRRVSNRDVTDRKIAEQELAIRAELLNCVSDSVFVVSLDGKILEVNDAAWRTRGFSREEILAMSFGDLVGPRYADAFPERLRLIAQHREGFLESEHRLKEGGVISVEIDSRVIDYRGESAVLCSVRDVTERKETVQILRRSERFNVSLNRISQAFLTSSEEQQMYQELLVALLEVMDSPQGLVGYLDDAGALVLSAVSVDSGGPKATHVVISEARWGETFWGVTLRSGEARYSNHPQNLPVWHFEVERLLMAPLVYQGKPSALLMVANRPGDYTEEDLQMLQGIGAQIAPVLKARLEQQQAVAALRENEGKLQIIFDVIQAGVIQVDPAGAVIYANQHMAEMFGMPMEELIGSDYCSHVAPEQRRLAGTSLRLLLTGELESAHYERHYQRKDGTVFWGYLTGRRLVGPDGKPAELVATITDMTDLKSAEEKRHRSEQQMLHVQKLESLGVLAGGIAHDFNNILLAIMGNTSLALQRVDQGSPLKQHLLQIEKASEKAADLARQMLAYSGKGRFVLEALDLNRVVREMTSMLEVSLSKKAVLRFHLAEELPGIVADPTQIRQIIMNLAINASEAIGEKSGEITIATGSLICDSHYLAENWLDEHLLEGRYVYLEVTDNGCGMSTETVDRIFEPFFTTKFTGRGLGMAAILGIVRGHKGVIKVYSEPGKGSSFKILLPATEAAVLPTAAVNMAEHWRGAGTVLLVDDEESVRDVASAMLHELGFVVISAADGRQALELYRRHGEGIALVLMDLNMPNLSGEEAFHELRKMDAEVRVILSSGFSEQEVTRKFLGKGLEGFVQKPYTLAALRAVLSQALSNKGSKSPEGQQNGQ